MTLRTDEKKIHLPASFQYPIKIPQKRYLTSLVFKPDLNAIENEVHNRLMKHNPSLLPYEPEIQNDLLLFLLYRKLMRVSALPSNKPKFDGRLTNREDIEQGFYSFLLSIRDTLAKDSPQYHPKIRKIKNGAVGALRRLGVVKK